MTTIAWDGKTLAADKRLVIGETHITTTKIFRWGDKLIGAAGTECPAVLAYIRGERDIPEDLKEGKGQACIIHPGGLVEHVCGESRFIVESRIWALGSGADFAVAAMHCGKTAAEAVAIAVLYDRGSGNGVDALELGV